MVWLLLACTPATPTPTATPTPVPTPVPTLPPTDDTGPGDTAFELEEPWVLIEGGTFWMGSDQEPNEMPVHEVTVQTFAIMRHEALHVDYVRCVDEGVCTPTPGNCYQGSNPLRPASCIDWYQAGTFCEWYGGRLPTESEWEFAASSRGQPFEYPWGDEEPDCTRANAGDGMGTPDCGSGLWDVCTHPAGDTPLGLCEMGGNIFEWVQDWYWDDYALHPSDGSAQTQMNNDFKTMRGGAVGSGAEVRVRKRVFHPRDFFYGGMGMRCVMDL